MSGEQCAKVYRQKFGTDPEWMIRCPGRVNLIGEHIDYSHYPVLPMAIEDSTWVAAGTCADCETTARGVRKVCLENVDPKYTAFTLNIGEDFGNASANGKSPKWEHYFLAGWRGALERLAALEATTNRNKIAGERETLARAKGMCAVVGSGIPPSAGLSSSSALVCAASLATLCVQTNQIFGQISKKELAEFSTKSERYVGMEGGGMDQACECLAERGSALRIDFSPSLQWRVVHLPPDALFAVLHSGKECNKGASSFYNQRVVECRLAAQVIAKIGGFTLVSGCCPLRSVRTLRDAAVLAGLAERPDKMVELARTHLGPTSGEHSREQLIQILGCTEAEFVEYSLNSSTQEMERFHLAKRAEHVFSEAARVLEFENVCKIGDSGEENLKKLAALMNASHKSCAELFECSCPELDATVAKCLEAGCLGARLTGAGWGGCVVALVESGAKAAVETSGLDVLFWSEPCAGIEALAFADFMEAAMGGSGGKKCCK